MTPEGRIKEKVKKALATLPQMYRFMPVQQGMGIPGLDFFTCIAGRFVAIETKAPGKKMTERQENTAAQIVAAGGLVFVIDSDESITLMMARIHLMIEFDNEPDRLAEAPSSRRPTPARGGDDVP